MFGECAFITTMMPPLPRRLLAAALVSGVAGCSPPPGSRPAPTVGATLDSLVLERSPCFGTCPAYRLRLSARGLVAFESRNPGDSGRTAVDSIAPDVATALLREAEALGFFDLPEVIARDRQLCPAKATDHPTATVTIFGERTKRVEDDHGCFAAPDRSVVSVVGRLRAFEASIDSVTGSARWVRPARRR